MNNDVKARSLEIKSAMTTFVKDTYHRDEVLSELFKLEDEVVRLTFNDTHAEYGNLTLQEVSKHLEQLSIERHGEIVDEVIDFRKDSYALHNMIKAEISGKKGEEKAFRRLQNLNCRNSIMKNVELANGDVRTELDAVVITTKGLFIVEVKNTAKDIFISEDGVYYRISDYMRKDSNLGSKMETKEKLLRKALEKAEITDINVERIVVFTNSSIEVQNKCEFIRTAFLDYLPIIIEDYAGRDIYSEESINNIARAIEDAKCSETYAVDEIVYRFKDAFAMAMAKIESTSAEENCMEELAKEYMRKPEIWDVLNNFISSPFAKEFGHAFAELVLSAVASKIIFKRAA